MVKRIEKRIVAVLLLLLVLEEAVRIWQRYNDDSVDFLYSSSAEKKGHEEEVREKREKDSAELLALWFCSYEKDQLLILSHREKGWTNV